MNFYEKRDLDTMIDDMEQHIPSCDHIGCELNPWSFFSILVYLRDGGIIDYNYLTKSYRYFDKFAKVEKYYNDEIVSEEDFKLRFAQRLYEKLAILGCTQMDLAYGTEISSGTISQYINGNIMPTCYNVLKICYFLGISPDELIGFGMETKQ